jgi:excisionase family DNA binding protein
MTPTRDDPPVLEEDDLLTAEEVAALLEVKTAWVHMLAARGAIPYVRPKRWWRAADYRFRRTEIEQWVRRDGGGSRDTL